MDPNDLLTTKQAAEVLGVDVRTVHRWHDAGRLNAAHKTPGLRGPILFDRGDVEALLSPASPSGSEGEQ